MTLPPARIATLTVVRGLAWGCIVTRVDENDAPVPFDDGTTARMTWRRRDGRGAPVVAVGIVAGADATFALDVAATLALDADTLVGSISYAPSGEATQAAPLGALVVRIVEAGEDGTGDAPLSQTLRVSAATQTLRVVATGAAGERAAALAASLVAQPARRHLVYAGAPETANTHGSWQSALYGALADGPTAQSPSAIDFLDTVVPGDLRAALAAEAAGAFVLVRGADGGTSTTDRTLLDLIAGRPVDLGAPGIDLDLGALRVPLTL